MRRLNHAVLAILTIVLTGFTVSAADAYRYTDRGNIVADFQGGVLNEKDLVRFYHEGKLGYDALVALIAGQPDPGPELGVAPARLSGQTPVRLVDRPRGRSLRAVYDEGFEGPDTYTERDLVGSSGDGWRTVDFNNRTPLGSTSLWCGPASATSTTATYRASTFAAAELNQTISLVGVTGSAQVSWYQDIKNTNDSEDFGRVEVLDQNGVWTPAVTFRRVNSNGWDQRVADLSAYAGQEIRLRWVHFSDGDDLVDRGYYIDDVVVSAASAASEILPTQTFDGFWDINNPPGDWIIQTTQTGSDPVTWRSDDQGGAQGTVALIAADFVDYDEFLISEELDCSQSSGVTISFWEDVLPIQAPVEFNVDVTTNNGASWINVLTRDFDDGTSTGTTEVDISSIADGESSVRIRFRFLGGPFAGEWRVDDVTVSGAGGSDLFADDFEGGAGNWATSVLDGPSEVLHVVGGSNETVVTPDGYAVAFTGDAARFFGDLNQSFQDNDSRPARGRGSYLPEDYGFLPFEQVVESPAIDLSSLTPGAAVTLNVQNRRYGTLVGWFLEYSTDQGATWTTTPISTPSNAGTPEVGDWELTSVLLNNVAGQSDVRLRFRMQVLRATNQAYGYWYIDDIAVDQDSTPPVILHAPLTNTWNAGDRTASIQANDPSGILDVAVFYREGPDDTFDEVAAPTSDGIFYNAVIPAPGEGSQIQYYVVARDGSGNEGSLPTGGDSTTPPAELFEYVYLPGDGEVLYSYDALADSPDRVVGLLEGLGYTVDAYDNQSETPPANGFLDYNFVVWETGENLSGADLTALTTFLDSPKRTGLIIAGDTIGLANGQSTFYQDYLRAEFIQSDPGSRRLEALPGEFIAGGLTIDLVGGNYAPNELDSDMTWPGATSVFRYSDVNQALYEPLSSGSAVVKNVDVDYGTVYFPFPFDAIGDDAALGGILDRGLEWTVTATIPTPTPTSTPTFTPTPEFTPGPTSTPTPTPSMTPTPSPTFTVTPVGSPTVTPTPTPTIPNATSVQYTFESGWNAFALGAEPRRPFTAATLVSQVNALGQGTVRFVVGYNGVDWDIHIAGIDGTDFSLELGRGYYVYVSGGPIAFELTGSALSSTPAQFFRGGWNFSAFPADVTSGDVASDLCANFPYAGVNLVLLADWEGSGYAVHVCGLPFADFGLSASKGYFVFVQ